jgi:Phage tail tube protein, GTA-gp10
MSANPARGEVGYLGHTLRPSFTALVNAEQEIGPLFLLVERAAAGTLSLTDMVALFWHCIDARPTHLARVDFAEAVAAAGLATATPALKVLLGQILKGQ